MPLMDEFKAERDDVKNRSFKERMKYFWDYYKWHVIGGAIGVIVVISLIYSFVTKKETAYYVVMANMLETYSSKDYVNEFTVLSGIDVKKQVINFDTGFVMDLERMDQATFTATQKIMVYLSNSSLDVMLGDRPVINQYAYNGSLGDLRNFLTKEELEKYESYFYYVDYALIRENEDSLNEDITYPENPMDPSAMKDPIPVAILLPECKKLREAYQFKQEQYFAVFINSKHPELNHLFLSYVMED